MFILCLILEPNIYWRSFFKWEAKTTGSQLPSSLTDCERNAVNSEKRSIFEIGEQRMDIGIISIDLNRLYEREHKLHIEDSVTLNFAQLRPSQFLDFFKYLVMIG